MAGPGPLTLVTFLAIWRQIDDSRKCDPFLDIVRSPKIPQIISGNFFSHAMDHRTEQVPQRGVLIKTPPKGAGFESGALGLLFSGRDEKGQLSRA
ncbi:hypothetical protein AVEN_251334-1 [Araneus ventricosus]|uniref:Uncharacterized protein n=1 Tax=Araneus ventricosus TaxID=182803 RepID=A0A4Y2LPL7_ARAVE|nr:hypothetical protein AVEN_251334-1 [Araneus ventricosus]